MTVTQFHTWNFYAFGAFWDSVGSQAVRCGMPMTVRRSSIPGTFMRLGVLGQCSQAVRRGRVQRAERAQVERSRISK